MERRCVGIDLHRRRSVIFIMNDDGERLSCVRIGNEPVRLLEEVAKGGDDAEVVIEATYGWYWAVDVLQENGFNVHLAHPAGNDWGKRRMKNDERDARDLADLLRLGRLAEAWIAPKPVRELRELVRYRAKLVQLRAGLKAQVHAVMAKEGVLPRYTEMFGPAGNAQLDAMQLAASYTNRVESLRDTIAHYDRDVAMLERCIHQQLRRDRGYQAIQAIPGVGPTIAAIFVAEIGDITRFRNAEPVTSWARLAPRHRESDTKVVRGPITKGGSKLVRWAAIEAVSGRRGGTQLRADYDAIAERRGKFKAWAAVARKLLTLVYLRHSTPASRSYVLAALRALHLDPAAPRDAPHTHDDSALSPTTQPHPLDTAPLLQTCRSPTRALAFGPVAGVWHREKCRSITAYCSSWRNTGLRRSIAPRERRWQWERTRGCWSRRRVSPSLRSPR